jgi:hypothetical protein
MRGPFVRRNHVSAEIENGRLVFLSACPARFAAVTIEESGCDFVIGQPEQGVEAMTEVRIVLAGPVSSWELRIADRLQRHLEGAGSLSLTTSDQKQNRSDEDPEWNSAQGCGSSEHFGLSPNRYSKPAAPISSMHAR